MKKKNLLIIIIALVIVGTSLVIGMRKGDLEGADGKAEQSIEEINAEYKPWASNLWEPPSGEVESLLFSLQAAIGGGFIGYYIGKKNVSNNNRVCKE